MFERKRNSGMGKENKQGEWKIYRSTKDVCK